MTILWTAKYLDGSILPQQEPNGSTNSYHDIDRDNLEAFILHWPDGRPVAVIDFVDDSSGDPDIGPKRLIWRKRHNQGSNGTHVSITLAGWQRTINGRNVQSILYINEQTGAVVLGGQWQEDRPLMHAPAIKEFE